MVDVWLPWWQSSEEIESSIGGMDVRVKHSRVEAHHWLEMRKPIWDVHCESEDSGTKRPRSDENDTMPLVKRFRGGEDIYSFGTV